MFELREDRDQHAYAAAITLSYVMNVLIPSKAPTQWIQQCKRSHTNLERRGHPPCHACLQRCPPVACPVTAANRTFTDQCQSRVPLKCIREIYTHTICITGPDTRVRDDSSFYVQPAVRRERSAMASTVAVSSPAPPLSHVGYPYYSSSIATCDR